MPLPNRTIAISSFAQGINGITIQQVQNAGADVVAVGGAIYKANSPSEAAKRLREKIVFPAAIA
jgi:3-hexulose-6-phosphate synthase